uniref:Uncharacterized protein n=1 Tax=Oryza nivara TaxID=4536 RepID=A0A0E0J460_ORYNI
MIVTFDSGSDMKRSKVGRGEMKPLGLDGFLYHCRHSTSLGETTTNRLAPVDRVPCYPFSFPFHRRHHLLRPPLEQELRRLRHREMKES